jgi:hypothetical protein
MLLAEIAKIKVGGPDDWSNYMGPVMFVFCSNAGKMATDDGVADALPLIKYWRILKRPNKLGEKSWLAELVCVPLNG